jgi:hypothetical protein
MILNDENIVQGNIYLTPPADGLISDEDSGDENDGVFDNLSSNQLRAPVEVVTTSITGEVQRHGCEDGDSEGSSAAEDDRSSDEDENEASVQEPLPKKRSVSVKRTHQWKTADLPDGLDTQRKWPQVQPPRFLREHRTPTELFEMFFDDEVVQHILTCTVQYATRDHGKHGFDIDTDELKVFFAILLISGYVILPRRTMYWEKSSDSHNEAISAAMGRNRFDDIMRFLHLCDNSNLDSKDRFAKIRPLYTLLNERCLLFYPFDRDISIDETMVPYFGRHPGKQFIRSKPVRFGFKLWNMCTSGGYAIQFEPYAGGKEKSSDRVDFGLGGSVVLDLLSEMPKLLPYNVAFDNFFTSIELVEHLGRMGIAATGTIRLNRLRDCPLKKKNILKNANRGTSKCVLDTSSDVVVVAWQDNKTVLLASNAIGVKPTGSVERWCRKRGERITVSQPNIVRIYNNTMGGVDRADQNVSAYRVSMRTKKWWWPLFAQSMDLMMQNAWLLYRKTPSYQVISLTNFLCSLLLQYT